MILLIAKDNCAGQPLIGKYDIFFVSVAEKLKCTSVYCANKVTISAYCIHVVTMSVLQVVWLWEWTLFLMFDLVSNWGTETDPDVKYHSGNSEPTGFGECELCGTLKH